MRRLASHLLIAVLGLQSLAWGLCPCALGKALQTLASAGATGEASRPCCPRCRKTPTQAPAPACPSSGLPVPGDDCPHCGALARGATSPTVSAPVAPLPMATDVWTGDLAPRVESAPVVGRSVLAARLAHGPPDVCVETVVLTI